MHVYILYVRSTGEQLGEYGCFDRAVWDQFHNASYDPIHLDIRTVYDN